jgi:hypothetical protein
MFSLVVHTETCGGESMMTNVRRADRPRSASRLAALVFAALIVVGALASTPASAELLEPLDLETGLELPVNDVIEDVTNLVTDVPEQLGGIVADTTNSITVPRKNPPGSLPKAPQTALTGSWSVDRLPALQNPSFESAVPTSDSGTSYRRPLSYGAAIGGGFRAAAGRAASLAGPLAAPIALALIAVGLLAVAAHGPGRLVKLDEERQSFRERRRFRL